VQAVGGAALNASSGATENAVDPAPAKAPTFAGGALALFAVIAPVAVALDQITKHLAVNELAGRESVRLLGGAVYLALTRNSGAAFSLGREYTFIFPVITVGVVVWIAWMVRRLRSWPWAVSLGLVLGGALGNFVDRIFRAPGPFQGHVVDFISVFGDHGERFPVFNVADSSLCCGVVLAILLELTGRRRDGTRVTKEEAAAAGASGG
jgi:signal peptidase II